MGHDEWNAPDEWGIRQVHVTRNDDRLQLDKFGVIGWGGNSGFHALNLAAQFGAAKIVLVGFDMRLDLGVHWHGKHPNGMCNPNNTAVLRWRKCIDSAEPVLAEVGIEVLNASPISALTAYCKVDFEEMMDALG